MEKEPNDPYERQLLDVFRSCLPEDENQLDRNGLIILCKKLELEEEHKNCIMQMIKIDPLQKLTVSFEEFKEGFLASLHKSHSSYCDKKSKDNIEAENMSDFNQFQSETCHLDFIENEIYSDCTFDTKDKNHTELYNSTKDVNILYQVPIFPKQTLVHMFQKLDVDSDGFINLDEFLYFFQLSNSHICITENVKNDSLHFEQSHNRIIARNIIIELWNLAGISEANALLIDLGFLSSEIDIIDLSNSLSNELKLYHDGYNFKDVEKYIRLLKSALILSEGEVRYLRNIIKQLYFEKEKLKCDLTEANARINSLAEEIEDYENSMEKTRQDQLKKLEERHAAAVDNLSYHLNMEQEKYEINIATLRKQLEFSQLEEEKMRDEVLQIKNELRIVETENMNQSEEILKLKANKNELIFKLQELSKNSCNEEIRSLEAEEIPILMNTIKQLQEELKYFKDQNDELTAELESFKSLDNEEKSTVSGAEMHSIQSDENNILINESSGPEKCGKDTLVNDRFQDKGITLFQSNQKNNNSLIHSGANEELKDFLISLQTCPKCTSLKTELLDAIKKLETVQNVSLSKGTKVYNLAVELETEYKKQVKDDCSQVDNETNQKLNDVETNSSCDILTSPKHEVCYDENNLENIKSENQRLLKRCKELEQSLDMLKCEYEQCEDYWALKLDEERQIFEQEQKVNDDRLSELLIKLEEYDEQFHKTEKKNANVRLSPIQEKFNLEQQYFDLEQEFENYKVLMEENLSKKQKAIDELRSQIKSSEKCSSVSDTSFAVCNGHMQHLYPNLYNLLRSGSCDRKNSCDSTEKNPKANNAQLQSHCSNCSQVEPIQIFSGHRYPKNNMKFSKKKLDTDIKNSLKEKEKLKKDILMLQNTGDNQNSLIFGLDGKVNSDILGTLANLYTKLYTQEEKYKYLQKICHAQQKEHEQIIQGILKHVSETSELKSLLKKTQKMLSEQIEVNKEQNKKLAAAEVLAKDLYEQNVKLLEAVKNLEQHCEILSKSHIEANT